MVGRATTDAPVHVAGSAARPGRAQLLGPTLVVAAAVGVAAWYLVLLLRRHDGLASQAYDLAFFQQLVWNLGRGNGLVSSLETGNFLGLHFSPLLALPAALEVIWPDARLLSALHVVGLAALGPATFLLVRALLRPSSAASMVAAALAAPVPIWAIVQEAARADFHTEAIGIPLALLAGWAGLSGRIPWMWLLGGAALLAKEDQAWAVAVVGLVVARAPGGAPSRRRQGLRLTAVSLVYGVVIVVAVMPLIRAATGGSTPFAGYYGWLPDALGAGGPGMAIEAAARSLGRLDGWLMAGGMVLSGAGLGVLRPSWLVLLVPPLALNLLSHHEPQPALRLHYGLSLLVPAVVASGLGARRLLAIGSVLRRRRAGQRGRRLSRRSSGWPIALAVPALVVALGQASLPPLAGAGGPFAYPPARESAESAAVLIPPAAKIAVDDGMAVLFANRQHLTLLGQPIPPDAWVVADRTPSLPGYIDRVIRAESLQTVTRERPLLHDDGRIRVWGPRGG